jgi:hypothetical protein
VVAEVEGVEFGGCGVGEGIIVVVVVNLLLIGCIWGSDI